jgi:hypothetical protein
VTISKKTIPYKKKNRTKTSKTSNLIFFQSDSNSIFYFQKKTENVFDFFSITTIIRLPLPRRHGIRQYDVLMILLQLAVRVLRVTTTMC